MILRVVWSRFRWVVFGSLLATVQFEVMLEFKSSSAFIQHQESAATLEDDIANMLTCSRLNVYLCRLTQKRNTAEADGNVIDVECF